MTDHRNGIYWYNLLTREHMFCTVCYRIAQQAQIAANAERRGRVDTEPWVRIADPEWFSAGISAFNPRTQAAYMTKLRAAFKTHWSLVHPDWPIKVLWSRP